MASSYTSLLKFNQPALGDAGWGTSINNGFTALVEQAMTGVVTKAVTVAGPNTLGTIADGVSSEGRNQFIVLTGVLASPASLTVPAASASNYKLYFVKNTASNSVTITAGGTGVIVPAGKSMALRVVNTDVEEALTHAVSLTLTNALAATSGGTGQSTYAVGDLIYASSTTALSKLTVGATNAVLTVAAGIPTWTPTLSAVSGGTGQSSYAVGDLLYASSTTALSKLTVGATNAVLTVAAGIPSWAATLPAVSGGTGLSSPGTAGNVLSSNGTTWQSVAVSTLVPAATDTVSGIVELATSAEVQAGTDTTRAVTPATLHAGSLVRGTVQNSTSGTSIDFVGATGIPSWAKRITIMFSAVSTNGTSSTLIQIGDSGGVETTGYTSYSSFGVSSNQFISSTAGFVLDPAQYLTSATLRYGSIVLVNVTGNVWVASGNILQDTGVVSNATGGKTLSDVLDRVRVTTVNGTDTFDAGQINILYE